MNRLLSLMIALPTIASAGRRTTLLLFVAAGVGLQAHAETTISLAVNAGTGDSSTLYSTQDTYRPFATILGKALGAKVEAKPLLASLVKSSIAGNLYPLLLVHTNDAPEAIKSKRYEAIGFSQDLKDNRILFFARNGSSAKSLADVAGRCVVATDPFAMATGEAILKKEKLLDKVKSYKYVRESDALEFYLTTKFCEIGVLRSGAIAGKLILAGHKPIYRSPDYPIFVLLADKKLGRAAIEKLRKLVVEFQPEPDSLFLKETGIVVFDTNQDSALELIDMY